MSIDLRLGSTGTPTYPKEEIGYNLIRSHRDQGRLKIADRIQIQISASRFAIMIRHFEYGHWSGYVLVPEVILNRIPLRDQNAMRMQSPEQISFTGPANAHITWAIPTRKEAKLNVPTNILLDHPDFWIGFSTYPLTHKSETDEGMKARLLAFEEFIWGFVNAHTRLRG